VRIITGLFYKENSMSRKNIDNTVCDPLYLAETIANMSDDRIVQFLDFLALKIGNKSVETNNNILKARLNCASHNIAIVANDFKAAMKIK
jgi:hypothetical protein